MPSKNVPSLENLVNQCCESYYSKLNESVADELNMKKITSKSSSIQSNQYYSYEKFQDFINASHCQENLKFLIEIFHYEKIWNRTFKRQSSILKCKDEEMKDMVSSLNSRKQSVATIRTMNSKKSNRHPSIVEEVPSNFSSNTTSNTPPLVTPPLSQHHTSEDIHETNDTTTNFPDDQEPNSPIINSTEPDNKLSHNDIDKLVQELSLPKILKSQDDIDTNSFLNQEHSLGKDSPAPTIRSTFTTQHQSLPQPHSISSHPSTSPPKKSTEVWDSLFKPSYICEKESECYCQPNISKSSADIDENDASVDEFNEAIQQQEVLEQLKEQLQEKFEYIMTNYVINNSPYQINLPDTVYSNLVKEYENNKILYHSPLTLLPAKNAVLQLLRENIYYNFLVDQENLINRENSQNIIKKMDELKVSSNNSTTNFTNNNNTNNNNDTNNDTNDHLSPPPSSSSSNNNNNKINTLTASTTQPRRSRELKSFRTRTGSIRSNSSEDSLKSRPNTPISTISNFLNKYHIKIHNSSSSSAASLNDPVLTNTTASNSNSNSSTSNNSPVSLNKGKSFPQKSHTFSSTGSTSSNGSTSGITTGKNSFQKHKHSHSAKYIKGPCGIEPTITDYDPQPPNQSQSPTPVAAPSSVEKHNAWSKMALKFKHKK